MKKYTTLLFLFFLALSCQAQEKPAAVAPEIEVTDIVYCHQQGPCLPIVLRVYLGDPDADFQPGVFKTMPRDSLYFEPLDLAQANSQAVVEQFFRLFGLITDSLGPWPEEEVDAAADFFDREYFFRGPGFRVEYVGTLKVEGQRFPVRLQNLGSIRNFEGFHRNRALVTKAGGDAVIAFPAFPDFRILIPSTC